MVISEEAPHDSLRYQFEFAFAPSAIPNSSSSSETEATGRQGVMMKAEQKEVVVHVWIDFGRKTFTVRVSPSLKKEDKVKVHPASTTPAASFRQFKLESQKQQQAVAQWSTPPPPTAIQQKHNSSAVTDMILSAHAVNGDGGAAASTPHGALQAHEARFAPIIQSLINDIGGTHRLPECRAERPLRIEARPAFAGIPELVASVRMLLRLLLMFAARWVRAVGHLWQLLQ